VSEQTESTNKFNSHLDEFLFDAHVNAFIAVADTLAEILPGKYRLEITMADGEAFCESVKDAYVQEEHQETLMHGWALLKDLADNLIGMAPEKFVCTVQIKAGDKSGTCLKYHFKY